MENESSFYEPEAEAEFHLADYLRVVSKNRWLVFGCILLAVAAAAWLTFTASPIYQARATMVIDPDQAFSPLADEAGRMGNYAAQAMTIKTHANLITTRPVIERVIRELNLESADRQGGLEVHPLRSRVREWIGNLRVLAGRETAVREPDPGRERLALIGRVRNKIRISEVRDTRLLGISVEDQQPEMARDIANALAGNYIRFHLENRTEHSQDNLRWLTDQLYDVQKKLEDAEAEFIAFKKSRQIVSVSGRQDLINQKIAEINARYLETRNDRLEIRAKLDKLGNVGRGRREDILRVRSLVPSPLIDNLYAQLLEAELEQGRLSKVYGERHPRMIQIVSGIEDIREKLGSEISKEMESMRSRHAILLDRERKLQEVLGDFEREALDTSQQELEFTIFQRNLDTHQKLYDTLLAKVRETDLSEKIETSGIRITEPAVIPAAPIRPRKSVNLALGLVLGVVAGLGLAFLREYMDQTIRTDEDVSRHLGLPVLSVIPEARKG